MIQKTQAGSAGRPVASSDNKPPAASRSASWATSNLVALGAAAALTIYSAGFAKTRAAAQRFAVEDEARRPATAASELSYPDEKRAEPASQTTAIETQPSANVAAAASDTVPAMVAAAVAKPAAASADSVVPKPATSDSAIAAAASTSSASAVAAIVAPPVTPPLSSTRDSSSGAGQATDSTVAKEKPAPRWKDGVYSGWGTSRHGDIEAFVEIRDGRIINAWISQCYTRYPCSRIAILPPQVAARQSADVDFVSRATQSTNAFYYGVLEALAKAK